MIKYSYCCRSTASIISIHACLYKDILSNILGTRKMYVIWIIYDQARQDKEGPPGERMVSVLYCLPPGHINYH